MAASLYNPFDPALLSDPYPYYAELRENHPVFWHEGMRAWVLTRYRDCREVLRDHETFARDRRRTGEEVPGFSQSLPSLDPPAQGPLRRLIMSAFRSQDLDGIGLRARTLIMRLFGKLADQETFNWMSEIATPMALSITADLMGVETPDRDYYVAISEGIARRMDAGLQPGNTEQGDLARTRLNALAKEWFTADVRPGVLRNVKENSAKAQVPEHYVRNSLGMMFNASYGTIFAAAGNVVL